MKQSINKTMVVAVGLMAATGMAQATLLSNSFSGSETIPDGNPVGAANSLSIDDTSGGLNNANVQDVSVTLNLSGGYDGDLYGYLVYQPSVGSGASTKMEVLLNQIGTAPFGDATAGMNVTLSDSGTAGIHGQTGTALTSGTGVYTPDSANTLDGTFGGQSADGTWTLFLADMSSGGGSGPSVLTGWTIDISVVPEPITWALVGFAGLLGTARYVAWRKQAKAV